METAASFVNQPIRQIRDFVDLVVEETDQIPRKLRADEPVNLTLTLTVSIEDELLERFAQELKTLERRLMIDQG